VKIFEPRPEAELRMFAFPYAGGGASIYRLWPRLLPPSVELVAVQLPGRESRWRDPSFRDLPTLVAEASKALRPHMDRPFVFFGHSMGGAISHELARALRDQGAALPRQLFVSGRPAPRAEDDGEDIHDLPKDEFIARLRDYAGTPEEVLQNEELMALVEPLVRADFAVCETYEFDPEPPPLDLPVTVFGGTGDEEVPREDLELWRQETTGEFRLHMLDGGHFFLNDEDRRDELLDLLVSELRERHLGRVGAAAH
jgi:medium-chain acyl-[acyl-carrier-protein] hydrolase